VRTVTPGGEIRLPKIGAVQAQGLSLDELKNQINLRYDAVVGGLEVEPALVEQAAHNLFVLGEGLLPGRYDMENTPTTVLGAIAMAGGHRVGANLRQVVVFRRGDNWELLSTVLDLRGAILGREAHPADKIWVRDGDVIILPASPIRLFDNFVTKCSRKASTGLSRSTRTTTSAKALTKDRFGDADATVHRPVNAGRFQVVAANPNVLRSAPRHRVDGADDGFQAASRQSVRNLISCQMPPGVDLIAEPTA
jgi:hypothetical protein